MSDTTQEQTEAAGAVVETPAVPDFNEAAEAEAAIAASERPAPVRRSKKPTATGRREPVAMTERRRAAYEAGEASKDKEYDEWIESWDWNQPRMYCTVKRTSPQIHLGKQVGGRLDGKPNGYFTEEEIQARFGGGTFAVYVSGVDPRTGKFRALGNKQVVIGAEPRLDSPPQSVVNAGTGAPQRQGGNVEDLAPQAQAGLVGLLGETIKHSRESGHASVADPEVLGQMQRAYEQQAHAVAAAADARVADFQQQLNNLRLENEKLRAENTGYQKKVETEVNAARSEGERFVGQMLPTFAAQSDQRVQQILHDTSEKVRSIQEQYARDLQNAQQHYQQQLQNQQTLFQAAEQNAQTLFQGQIQYLQTINATLQAKIDSLEGECRALRDQVMNMHQEAARKQDPLSRLQEIQTFQEVIQGMSGGGGGDDFLGEDASPAMKLAARFAPAIAGAIDVAKAKMGIGGGGGEQPMMQPQPMPPQMMAPRVRPAVPRVAVPQPPPGAMIKAQPQQPAQQPQRRARIPRQDAKVSRQDLVAGITLLNAAIASGTTPQVAADAASSQIDRATLNALCSRRPEVVIQSLQSAGILQGAVASTEGQQYLMAFLQALQARLNPAPPAAPAQRPAEAPPAAPAAEEPTDGEA